MLERVLKERGAVVHRGGDFDDWDLQVRGGLLGSARVQMAVEEHGQGRQLARLRVSPRCSPFALGSAVPLIALSIGAGAAGGWTACGSMALMALILTLCTMQECHDAGASVVRARVHWLAADPSVTPIPAHSAGDPALVRSGPIRVRTVVPAVAKRSQVLAREKSGD